MVGPDELGVLSMHNTAFQSHQNNTCPRISPSGLGAPVPINGYAAARPDSPLPLFRMCSSRSALLESSHPSIHSFIYTYPYTPLLRSTRLFVRQWPPPFVFIKGSTM
jgi:hypothetical protein